MGILYAMVARGHVVLAEFSAAATSNAGVVARQVLEKLPQGNADSNVSYSQDRYVFHVKRTDGLVALCMADDAAETPPYAMTDEFSRILSQEMDRYSNDPNADRLNRLKGEMSQVRTIMIYNIEKVLERGDRLALLIEKASTMQGNTLRFRKQSRRFKKIVWWGSL